MTFPDLLAWLNVFIAVPIAWAVAIMLFRVSRSQPDNGVLRERFFGQVMLVAVVSIFAIVFINNGMEEPRPMGLTQTQIVTRLAILSLTLPALYWLVLYRKLQ